MYYQIRRSKREIDKPTAKVGDRSAVNLVRMRSAKEYLVIFYFYLLLIYVDHFGNKGALLEKFIFIQVWYVPDNKESAVC
jgi:hypothetical protein